MSREETRKILESENILPRSRFGQNFLVDDDAISRITALVDADREDPVLEIGPGLGALTKPLSALYDHLTAVEIDSDLYSYLVNEAKVSATLINKDFLKLAAEDYSADKIRYVVSNLPYYCMTPIMKKLFGECTNAKRMVLMTEDEAFPRISAGPNNKDYGPLAVCVSLFGDTVKEFTVPGQCFYPVPKTLSCVITLNRGEEASVLCPEFIGFVEKCFAMRRKKLMNNLKPYYPADILNKVIEDKDLRAEDLTPVEFSRLYSDIISMISEK